MPGPSMSAVPTLFLASKYHGSVQAELHARELNRDRFVDTTGERYTYSNALTREYCLFRMKWKPQDGRLGSDGTCESFQCVQLSFFKSRIPNFIAPKGQQQALKPPDVCKQIFHLRQVIRCSTILNFSSRGGIFSIMQWQYPMDRVTNPLLLKSAGAELFESDPPAPEA
jgi:hypothetical protein